MNRVVRAVLALLGLVAIGVPPVAAGEPVDAGSSLRWTADSTPFRLTFLDHGRPLLAQAGGGSMAYTLTDGSTHRLTDVQTTEHGHGATTYTVGTDEPARTARVTVAGTPRGLRVQWGLEPATGVIQVSEAFTGDDAEHFL